MQCVRKNFDVLVLLSAERERKRGHRSVGCCMQAPPCVLMRSTVDIYHLYWATLYAMGPVTRYSTMNVNAPASIPMKGTLFKTITPTARSKKVFFVTHSHSRDGDGLSPTRFSRDRKALIVQRCAAMTTTLGGGAQGTNSATHTCPHYSATGKFAHAKRNQ